MSYYQLCNKYNWFTLGCNEQYVYCMELADDLIRAKYHESHLAVMKYFELLVELTYIFTLNGVNKDFIRKVLREEYLD